MALSLRLAHTSVHHPKAFSKDEGRCTFDACLRVIFQCLRAMRIDSLPTMRMLRGRWVLGVVMAGLWIASGCSGKREVTGQVFVVTKGGENVKLGLVGIHVVGERQLIEIGTKLLGEAQKAKAGEVLLLQLEAEVAALTSTVPSARSGPLDRIRDEAIARRTGIQRFSGGVLSRRFFQEMPPSMARTDADGLFTVDAKTSDWLAARGERKAGAETETYLWLMPLKERPRKLLVSNDRLLNDDDDLARLLAGVCASGNSTADKELVAWVEGQRIAAKQAVSEAKAAEEKALAEAKAKAEAAEVALASKLGLSRPFAQGVRGQVGAIFVRWIPAGRFTMGSPSSEEGRYSDETQHEVALRHGIFMAETECTQVQWEAVMGSNPSKFKGKDRPVEEVSWGEAVEYCRKLTLKQREEGVLAEGWEWRLPTEAEWEYAARAGTMGARYGELDAIAWHGGNAGSETHGVREKQANAWGLHDMIGNVWEWCGDWYGDYPLGSVTDPKGPGPGSVRVDRGGSYNDGAGYARSAERNGNDPGDLGINLGFRPALSLVR
jgi:formylglycine-generating enzyme required for sulfatase activity